VPGSYRVYVSPMREASGWFYEQGWPLLVIDASADDGGVTGWSLRIVTLRACGPR